MVDIGANVGDSAAALCGPAMIDVICVEGSPTFFESLQKNAQLIRSSGHRVTCVNAIIGPKGARANLVECGSTATVAISPHGSLTQTLDEVSTRFGDPSRGPTLIKVDTDGFDAQVVASGEYTLRQHEPLLFWENYIASAPQLQQFVSLYEWLATMNYDRFTVFDNFGNVMLETDRIQELVCLATYTATLSYNLSARTIYYTDIFASTAKHRHIHRDAVTAYRSKYLTPDLLVPQ